MYERSPVRVGGAERQMVLLGRSLATRGVPVAHIVFPPSAPAVSRNGALTLVARGPYAGRDGIKSKLLEAWHIWRALRAADSAVYIVRGGSPALGVAAVFCRMRRRRLIFSSAIDGDFTLQTLSAGRHRVVLYRAGLESASAIVVQSRQQLELARRALRRVPRLECIPSFAEDPPEPELPRPAPEAFLWIGRLIDYKRPLQYLELARAMPETHFWMLGVSNESQSYAAEIVERATGMPNLELLEPRPHAETMQLVRRAIAIVSTSRLEGMPNVFLEAWGRGVPVLSLSFDPDGIIEANELGTAANDDWERFVGAARELADGGGDRAGVAARGPAYVRATHAPDAVTDRWQRLIDELAGV